MHCCELERDCTTTTLSWQFSMQYLDVIKSWLYDLLETITSCVHLHRWPPLYKPNETLWNRSHFLIIICICNIRTLIMDVLTFYFNWISFPVGFGLSGVQPVTSLQITSSHRSLKLDIQNAKSDSSKIKIYYVDWDVYMLLYLLDSSDFFLLLCASSRSLWGVS